MWTSREADATEETDERLQQLTYVKLNDCSIYCYRPSIDAFIFGSNARWLNQPKDACLVLMIDPTHSCKAWPLHCNSDE